VDEWEENVVDDLADGLVGHRVAAQQHLVTKQVDWHRHDPFAQIGRTEYRSATACGSAPARA
jgi:hypothetical protein